MESLFQHCWLSLKKHCLQSFRKTNFATAFTKLISRLQTKGLARKISARPLCWTIHQLLNSVEFHTSIQLLREKILLVSFLLFVYQKCQQKQQQINVSTEQPSTPSFQLNHSNSIVQLLYTIQIKVVYSCRSTQTTDPICFQLFVSFQNSNTIQWVETLLLPTFLCSYFETQELCAHPATSPRWSALHLLVLKLVELIVWFQFFSYVSWLGRISDAIHRLLTTWHQPTRLACAS